jgi:putative N6-adenine-specific DNA methylase
VRESADAAITAIDKKLISGSDIDAAAIGIARSNLARLPHGDLVALRRADFLDIDSFQDGTILTNPPYGLRIGRVGIEDFYRNVGDFLKHACTRSSAYIYVGKPALLKSVGLRTTWKKELGNGGLDGRLAKYDLY